MLLIHSFLLCFFFLHTVQFTKEAAIVSISQVGKLTEVMGSVGPVAITVEFRFPHSLLCRCAPVDHIADGGARSEISAVAVYYLIVRVSGQNTFYV